MTDEKNIPNYKEEITDFPEQTTFNSDDMSCVENEEEK